MNHALTMYHNYSHCHVEDAAGTRGRPHWGNIPFEALRSISVVLLTSKGLYVAHSAFSCSQGLLLDLCAMKL